MSLWFGSSDVPLYDVVVPFDCDLVHRMSRCTTSLFLFIVISGFRVLISGIYVSPTFTMGIDIYVIYCGLVNEIRSMTFLFILSRLVWYWLISCWFSITYLSQLGIVIIICLCHISYYISLHLIFIARLIRLLFSY